MTNDHDHRHPVEAIFWDFGGVFTTSPFVAFNRYEASNGIPKNFIRTMNATNGDTNAWAKLERNEVTIKEFNRLFEEEALALGISLNGDAVLSCTVGELRPDMVKALKFLRKSYKMACLTNNFGNKTADNDKLNVNDNVMKMFDQVIESRKMGVRKPERQFYVNACEALNVRPTQVIFLDDLGVNLKPARELGMRTIKVLSSNQALMDLEALLGHKIEQLSSKEGFSGPLLGHVVN